MEEEEKDGTIRPDTRQRNINTGCINMYTRYLHRKRGARYLCSPPLPPLERTHLGGVVNSASEGGRRTDISAFCPRSLESHFNARIDAWNAPSCPFFPFFLPSPSPRLENPWDDHHPPSFHQETLFPGKRKIRKGVDLSSPRDLLSSPSRERIRKKRDTTTLISSIRRVIVMQRVRQGPLTVTRDISISFDSMPRLSLTTSPIRDRKTLGIGSRRGCGSFHGFVKEDRYEG